MTRFSNSFWNSELGNFTGFEVLCKRMKDGKQFTKDYSDFLKLRAQAQENYGKSLIKIAKTIGGKEEVGTLRQAWEILRVQTENIGQSHITTANNLIEETNRVLEFMEQQREQRKRLEDNIRRIQTNIKFLSKKTMDCKKVCEAKCREAEQLTQQMNDTGRNNAPIKDIDKLRQKHTKAVLNAEQSDANYRSAVDNLEQTRVLWEQETEKTCDDFQLLEEERINYNRNSMWIVTNIGSAMAVREDDLLEGIRKGLEKCDVEADIQLFIRQKQTGSERPESIEFENFFGGLHEKNGNQTVQLKSQGNIRMGLAGVGGNGGNVQPQPRPNSPVNRSAKIHSELTDSDVGESLVNELYDSVNLNIKPKKIQCRALYDFEGRTADELTLKENDVVYLIQKENREWWEVETESGSKGYFPAVYLELQRLRCCNYFNCSSFEGGM